MRLLEAPEGQCTGIRRDRQARGIGDEVTGGKSRHETGHIGLCKPL